MALAYEQRIDDWVSLAAELAEVDEESPGRTVLLELRKMVLEGGRNFSVVILCLVIAG